MKQLEGIQLTDKRQLSKESKEFLENLRLYLFSSGKQEVEINEIVEELEAHLCEAEQNGKPIEKIVGQSPQQYMEMLSQELTVDHRSWIKYIILIIAGSFSFKIFSDLLEGSLTYSVLEIVGHIVISLIFLVSLFAGFKWIAAKNFSTKKQALLLFGISTLPITLFVGLIF